MADDDPPTRTAGAPAGGLRLERVVVRDAEGAPSAPLDVEVPAGDVLVLVGDPDDLPTAVLRVVAGIDEPVSGDVHRRGSAGLVTRQHHLLGSLTAAENVAVPLLDRSGRRGGRGGPLDGRDVEAQLDRLGVPESGWHNLLEQLSGGQQQRVAVARALIGAPEILCLDDPTSELDLASADIVWREVDAARRAGACVLTTAVTAAEARALGARFAATADAWGAGRTIIREV